MINYIKKERRKQYLIRRNYFYGYTFEYLHTPLSQITSFIPWDDIKTEQFWTISSVLNLACHLLVFVILTILIKRWKKASALPLSSSPDTDTSEHTDLATTTGHDKSKL